MITFKQFIEDARGAHGEYSNDVTEKTMVNYIIRLLFNNVRDDKNYSEVYSFIESRMFAPLYDKYYDAFTEKSESGKAIKQGKEAVLSPKAKQLLDDFKSTIKGVFNQWKASKDKK